MNAALSAEQQELRAVVRALLQKESPEPVVRATMESAEGYDRALWTMMATELGLQGLAIPEEYGGAGAGWVEQGLVLEEMGRALLCAPYLSTVGLAVPALLASGDALAAERWLPAIADGRLVATAALTGVLRRTDVDLPITAARDGSGWRLTGTEPHVLDGAAADLLLVLARTDGGASVFAVEAAADGMRLTTPRTSDLTRRIARVELSQTPAQLVGQEDAGWDIARQVLPRAVAVLACEQVGGAARALELAVDYSKTRIQFGRAIGSFQAVKHRCADMLVAVETARSAAWAVVRAADRDAPDLSLVASLARAVCSDAYVRCASDCVQVHGGIGYTWEHPAHLHVKRSRGSAVLLGTAHEHRTLVAELAPVLGTRREEGAST
ncbi:MAG: acyl-CoA dehydrogenase protein [Streptosporangiaceae bacterium]|nr:acyl-CoA dehydrogenase protein [Streptosporangiaceae bacterium]